MKHDMESRERKLGQSLKIIAAKEGLTEDEVRDGIARAVSYALKSSDPEIRHFWQNIPCEGDAPTIEEIIVFLAEKIAGEET